MSTKLAKAPHAQTRTKAPAVAQLSSAGNSAILNRSQVAGNFAIQRQAVGGRDGVAHGPGSSPLSALAAAGGGQALSPSSRRGMESAFGRDLSGIRIHTDSTAVRAASEVKARAFTSGRHVFFGEGYSPATRSGARLLAHEITHTLQTRDSGPSHTQALHLGPRNSAVEREAESVAQAVDRGQHIPRIRQSIPVGQLSRDPLPELSTVQIGAELDSDDPAVRVAMLTRLSKHDDEPSWRALMLGQTSRHEDVRAEIDAIIRTYVKNKPTFRRYLENLASTPRGAISDLAVRALANVGSGGKVNLENYSTVIYQRLDLARSYLREMDDQLYELINVVSGGHIARGAPTPFPVIDELQGLAFTVPIEKLWEVGLRASTLLDQIAPVRQAVKQLQAGAAQAGEGSEVRRVVQNQLMRLLMAVRSLTGEHDDPAAIAVQQAMTAFPAKFAAAIVKQLHDGFTKARDEIQKKLTADRLDAESDLVKQEWQRVMQNVVQPTQDDLALIINELETLREGADGYPEAVLARLQSLQPILSSIGERGRYLMDAASMLDLYAHFKETNAWFGDSPIPLSDKARAFIFDFASIAANRDRNPEKAQENYERLMTGPRYEELRQDTEEWQKTLERMAEHQKYLGFAIDVFIIILSIYTGGLAGTLVKGGGAALGLGRFALTRLATRGLVFSANVTAFTATNRGMRWAIYDESFTKDFGIDLGKNAVLFFWLSKTGALYQRFGAPRLPVALRAAGAQTATFTAFQAWSVGLHRFEKGEWILPNDKRFWSMAAHNALFLGAIHLGSGIVKPLFARIESPVLRMTLNQHNKHSAALQAELRDLKPQDTNRAERIVNRVKNLYVERLDVLRKIHANDPNELSVDQLAHAEGVLRSQVQAAENVLFQFRFDMAKHESLEDTYYYSGDTQEFRDHYERQGYEILEMDANTGRMRLRTPEGEIVDLLRTREQPGDALEASPGKLAAIAQYQRALTNSVGAIARKTGIPEAGTEWRIMEFDQKSGQLKAIGRSRGDYAIVTINIRTLDGELLHPRTGRIVQIRGGTPTEAPQLSGTIAVATDVASPRSTSQQEAAEAGGTQARPQLPSGPITVREQTTRVQELLSKQRRIKQDIAREDGIQISAGKVIDALQPKQDSTGLNAKLKDRLDDANTRYNDSRAREKTLRADLLTVESALTEVRRHAVQSNSWQEHQVSVYQRQVADHPGMPVGEQVTLEVTDVATNTTVDIVADVAILENGKLKLVDAKYSVGDLTRGKLGSGVYTPNQNRAYRWISAGNKVWVVPTGANAARMGLKIGEAIEVVPMIEVHVNSPEGIRVRNFTDTI